jgi:hypothetical protein
MLIFYCVAFLVGVFFSIKPRLFLKTKNTTAAGIGILSIILMGMIFRLTNAA